MAGEELAAADWAGARGDKWCVQLDAMEGMLAGIDEVLIDALNLDAALRIADIGCGGGATSLNIARRAPAGSSVAGFDISTALIAAAQARLTSHDAAITFTQANVAEYRPQPGAFDRLVSRFGIMFYDSPQSAFANLYNWLAPGGQFAFASWASISRNPWLLSVREAVSKVIEIPEIDPQAPGPFRYANPEDLLGVLASCGFVDLENQVWRGQLPIGGGLAAAEAAQFVLQALSVGELLNDAGPGAEHAAIDELIAVFSKHLQAGHVVMDACVNIFTGQRPAASAAKT